MVDVCPGLAGVCRRLLLLLASSLLVVATADAGVITIDDFTWGDEQIVAVSGTGSATSTVTGLSKVHTVGGARQLTLDGTGRFSKYLQVSPDYGTIDLVTGPMSGATGTLRYDANGAGLNLAALSLLRATTSTTYFQAQVLFSDLNLSFGAGFEDSRGNIATWAANLGNGTSLISQALSGFTNAGAVDFNSIRSLWVPLSGPQAQDATLSMFQLTSPNTPFTPLVPDTIPTPEPASMLLFGSGLIAIARQLRTRRAR